jgi:hypothetical protein
MNVVDYCKGMEMELIAWKAKMYDLTRKVESLGSKELEKVLPNIQDLNILITDMSARIEQLKNECPTEWTPRRRISTVARSICALNTKRPWNISGNIHPCRLRAENFVNHPRKGSENLSEPFLCTQMHA